MKPFENKDSPVRQSGLVLLSVDEVLLKSPSYDRLWSNYTQDSQFLCLMFTTDVCCLICLFYGKINVRCLLSISIKTLLLHCHTIKYI